MSIAIADALIQGTEITCGSGIDSYRSVSVAPDILIDIMKKWGRRYPDTGYGVRFGSWLFSGSREPYNSWVTAQRCVLPPAAG